MKTYLGTTVTKIAAMDALGSIYSAKKDARSLRNNSGVRANEAFFLVFLAACFNPQDIRIWSTTS